jgi:hypothetical protein
MPSPSSLLSRVGNVRYSELIEDYARVGGRGALNQQRSGPLNVINVVARAQVHADQLANPSTNDDGAPQVPPPNPSGGALAALAQGLDAAVAWEAALTAITVGAIPFPEFPALRVFDLAIGLPHAHNHWPNLTPPNPVPIPLPGLGPIIPIPFVSGAMRTHVHGRLAARCGDMGVGIWCGSFFPIFEVFLGSSSTWIEGARAGRVVVDITKHCTFSVPKPSDPPLGPMVGVTVPTGAVSVIIGGVPMPSLFNLALGGLFKAGFRAAGAAFRRLTAARFVDKLIGKGRIKITGPSKFPKAVRDDLVTMARTRAGRGTLRALGRTGKSVEIKPYGGNGLNALTYRLSPADALMPPVQGRLRLHGNTGSDSLIEHNPFIWHNHTPMPAGVPHSNPGTTSADVLHHELGHAVNNARGMNRVDLPIPTAHDWPGRWKNLEEYRTTHVDNGYRRDMGLPQRTNYDHAP